MTKAKEIWVTLKGHSDYEISNYGNVRSKTRNISYLNKQGNEVFYTLFSQPIKVNHDGTPAFRITTTDESGKKIGHHFRMDEQMELHFGKNHYFVSRFNGVRPDRSIRTEYRREYRDRAYQEELVSPSNDEVHPLLPKLKKFAEEIKPETSLSETLHDVMLENKRLKEVIKLLLDK